MNQFMTRRMQQTHPKTKLATNPYFMGIDNARPQAKDLLADLRQAFLFHPRANNPMQVLAAIEDQYPEAKHHCDTLRLTFLMEKDMGLARVKHIRAQNCDAIAGIVAREIKAADLLGAGSYHPRLSG